MRIERTSLVGLLASVVLLVGTARGQDFNERYAAWQGRASMAQRTTVPPIDVPELGGEAEPMPPTTGRNGQRILADVYNAPLHAPDYNRPWTTSPCATCSHNPVFPPAADPLGTCDYGGGGGWGGYGPDGYCDGGACGGCGAYGCGQCGGKGGGCDWGPLCSNPIVWARFEVLLWWRQGRDLPPLVTTDPTTESSTTAGILPDAQILFGGGRVGTNMQAGGRADIGFFTDPRQCVGFGDRFFGLGKDASNFHVSSNNVPVLAVPFVDFSTGNNDAVLIAFPGLRFGSINVSSSSNIIGNDVYARFLLCRDCNHRLDFITGWNYTRVADEVQIRTRSTVISDPTIAAGTVLATLDQFKARNDFNGGILGLLWQRNCGCWTTQVLTRMSLGNMHETSIINGSGTATLNGNTQPTDAIFTRPSNIGERSRDEFTAITELGFNLGYRFSPCTQLTVGYTFIYWNDILQAGTGIDTRIGTSGGATHPQFAFRHSDFWVQGLNLGLTREF